MKKGIAIAGNLLVDHVKMVDVWPEKGMLCNIRKQKASIGGCAGNTASDLARIDSRIPLRCYGKVGADEDGAYIMNSLGSLGVCTDFVKREKELVTSYTDVITDMRTGERTFFHARGAHAHFRYEDMDLEFLEADIFHIGYALLLDELDKEDPEYGSVMARVLSQVRKKGIRTSMDVVSEEGERFQKVVIPSLKYCDYLIANEIEGGKIVGIEPRDEKGVILPERMEKICREILHKGVKELVVLHAPEGGFAMNRDEVFYKKPSLKLPEGFIKGSVGAGDAFCAGMLYALYREYEVEEALEFANLSAVCSLSEEDSVSGMRCYSEMKELQEILLKDNKR